MADDKIPLILENGEIKQIQSGDKIDSDFYTGGGGTTYTAGTGISIVSDIISANWNTSTLIDNADSPYTILSTDELILADSTNGAVSIILPATGNAKNIKWNAGANTITVTVTSSGTIDGSSSFVFNTNYEVGTSITVNNISSGNWVII